MLLNALLVFCITALGGLVLASFVLRGRLAPWAISLLHALLGACGLVLLVIGVLQHGLRPLPLAALAALLLAAGFGFYLASVHYGRRLALRRVVFAHAGAAVLGVVLLLLAVLGG